MKYIKKSECIDDGFYSFIKAIRPFRKDLFRDTLNDKLFMLNEVEKVSHDPSLKKEIGQMMQRLTEMNRINAQIEKLKK